MADKIQKTVANANAPQADTNPATTAQQAGPSRPSANATQMQNGNIPGTSPVPNNWGNGTTLTPEQMQAAADQTNRIVQQVANSAPSSMAQTGGYTAGLTEKDVKAFLGGQ